MTNYSWIISQLDTAPQDGNLHDVVKVIHWRYQGTEIVGDKTYTAQVYSSYGCAQPSETDFTAYPDLTEEQVVSWLEAGLDVSSLQANIDAQIENQKNPPIVNLGLPWQTQA
jgi:hypothetical protein